MDLFNLLAGICSIVGLFVSCFTASKVYKMSNVKAGDNSTIQNGKKNIHVDGGGNSYSAGDQSTITAYHFTEQVEKEPPHIIKCFLLKIQGFSTFLSQRINHSYEHFDVSGTEIVVLRYTK